MQILYCINIEVFRYYKITAVKSDDWIWGEGELTDDFNVLNFTMTDEQIVEWSNLNKWCVNDTQDGITETPEEYQYPPEEE